MTQVVALGACTSERSGRRRLLIGSLFFVAGFSLVFVSLGALLGGLGRLLLQWAPVLTQDYTVKALVPAGRRGTGYSMFAAVQGAAAVAGGALAGTLSAHSVPALVAVVAVLQLAAPILVLRTLRTPPGQERRPA